MLEEGKAEACIKIKALLEQSLNSIRMVIEPQITGYQQLINDAKQGRVEYEIAIEWSEDLQSRLIKFFRSRALLFHPDKTNGNKDLSQIQTELFKEFHQLSETALETLRAGLRVLKNCIPPWKSKYKGVLEEIQRDREKSRAEFEEAMKRSVKLKAQLARMEEKLERLSDLLTENMAMHHSSVLVAT